jgi:hypothetical protein
MASLPSSNHYGVMLNALSGQHRRAARHPADLVKVLHEPRCRRRLLAALSAADLLPQRSRPRLLGHRLRPQRGTGHAGRPDGTGELGIQFKFDLVLNHLSVASPQFRDLLENGDDSDYKDFFVDWNAFWGARARWGRTGTWSRGPEHLEKLFLRKPGLPILDVRFPDGTDRPYWNTFYQKVSYRPVAPAS